MCSAVNRRDRLCLLDEPPRLDERSRHKTVRKAFLVNAYRRSRTSEIWATPRRGKRKERLFADTKAAKNACHDILITNFPCKLSDKRDYFTDFFDIDFF